MTTHHRWSRPSIFRAALTLALVYLALAGAIAVAEITVAICAGVAAAAMGVSLARRARATLHPPVRWAGAIGAAVPALAVESVYLAGAMGRQLAGGAHVDGAGDEAPVPQARDVDAMTFAIAAAAFPCLTPNTVVARVRHGLVTGRRILDWPGHALRDDLARLA